MLLTDGARKPKVWVMAHEASHTNRDGQMIVLTRLNDARFAINPDLIERIHATPDTTLVMVDGAKYIVTESMNEVIALIAGYRAQVISMARDLPVQGLRLQQPLGLVPDVSPARQTGDDSKEGNTVPLRPRNT